MVVVTIISGLVLLVAVQRMGWTTGEPIWSEEAI